MIKAEIPHCVEMKVCANLNFLAINLAQRTKNKLVLSNAGVGRKYSKALLVPISRVGI